MKNFNIGSIVNVLAVFAVFGLAGPISALAATTPTLGTAATFGILSSTFTRNIGLTAVTGDLGYISLGGEGTHTASGATVITPSAQVGSDQGIALSSLNGEACTFDFADGAINLATDTTHGTAGVYTPGVYCTHTGGAASIGTAGITLHGTGTYIFRINGAFTTVDNSHVTLDGANASDVFWTPTEATTLGANTTFMGTIIDDSGITVGHSTAWTGRALAFAGTVTTDTDTVAVPGASTPTIRACNGSSFDNFTLGSVNGQNGWSATGPFDQAIVDNTYGYSSFGCKSLRLSDKITSGSFGDQIFSPSITNETGETDAINGGMSSGTRQTHFDAQFDLASIMPTLQSGMHVSVSPDRGDGSRMSYLRFEDSANGINVFFDDVQGTTNPATFVEKQIATGLSQATSHTIKFAMDFVNGPSNDIVQIYIDGVLVHTGTSWENYFRYDTEATQNNVSLENKSRTVDSLLFRESGVATLADAGKGFILDNFLLSSSASVPVTDIQTTPTVSGDEASSTIPFDTTQTGSDNNGGTVTADIPSGTVVTGDSTWNGLISAPTPPGTAQIVTIPDFDTTVTSAFTVGSSQSDLTFDKAVKLTFAGQSGQHVGWYNNAGIFTEITDICAANDQTTGDALAAGASCKIDVGGDLVVWTKHFSTFVTYTQTATSAPAPVSSGGGSGVGGARHPIQGAATGEVLGAFTTSPAIQAQINSIKAQLVILIQQLINMLQAQLVIAQANQ